MPPLVSIVTTVYNRATYLAQAIESVLAQTESNFELIVLDDGSTDGSIKVAQQYASMDERIRFIHAKHQGQGFALNTAFSFAQGKYLGLLDSDDWLAPQALAETVRVLESFPEASMVYSDYYDVSESGEIIGLGHRCRIPYSKDRLLLDFMTFHFRLFRQDMYKQIGGIDPQFECAPDYDMSLKLSEKGEVVHLRKALYFYRHHAGSISARKKGEQAHYSLKAVTDGLRRRGLSQHLTVEMLPESKLVFKRKTAPTNGLGEKVFGIGLGKTGAGLLSSVLAELGYQLGTLTLLTERPQDCSAIARPDIARSFRELDWRYPNARFILTVCSVEEWLMLWQRSEREATQSTAVEEMAQARRLRLRHFGRYDFDADVWRDAYWQHYQEVTGYFNHRSQQLLIWDFSKANRWEPLCEFLSKPVPNIPLLHSTRSTRSA